MQMCHSVKAGLTHKVMQRRIVPEVAQGEFAQVGKATGKEDRVDELRGKRQRLDWTGDEREV